jgi:hypothetical protein
MRSTFVSPAPDRNIGYPWFHYVVVSAAQAPYLAALWITGDFSAPRATFPFGLADPVRDLKVLTVIGRLVSVAMAAGIVAASFFFARAFWGQAAGLVAAILTMLSYPMFYYSRTGNLDVPAFFWSAVGLAIFARILTQGLTARRALGLGLFAGLAVATKDQAVLLFVPALAVLLVPRWTGISRGPYAWAPIATLVLAGLAAYVAAAGMLVDPARHIQHVQALLFDQRRVSVAAEYFPPAPATWAGTRQLLSGFGSGLAQMMGWPVLIASAMGFVLAVRASSVHWLWLLPFVTTFLLLVRVPGLVILRYLLPLTLFVDAFAAVALVRVSRSRPWAFRGLFVVLAGWRLAVGIDLSYAQWRETRDDASIWLRQHYREGDMIGHFGVTEVLPALESHMMSRRIVAREAGTEESDPGAAVLGYLRRERPRFVVVIPDWTGPQMEHSADCPPEAFRALLDGSAGYSLRAYFAPPALLFGRPARPPLDNPSVAPPVRIFERAHAAEPF